MPADPGRRLGAACPIRSNNGGGRVASGTHWGVVVPPLSEAADRADELDRVLHTAGDRPNTDTLPALIDPTVDHADGELARRRADVEEKHRRVCDYLDA